ncbi:MAG: dihydrolipoamide acetyltransferase family protein, partial [Nitriliruptoraceae bacterium]
VGQVLAIIGDADDTPAQPSDTNRDTENTDDTDDTNRDTENTDDTTTDQTDNHTETPQPSASEKTDPGAGVLTSPLVRKLLREAGIAPDSVTGTGKGGRITREDAERAIAAGPASAEDAPRSDRQPAVADAVGASRGVASAPERPAASPTQIDFGGEREVTVELSRIRRAIARSMMDSLHNTAQLTAAVEVDVTAIMNLRNAVKDDFKSREGASLTPLALIARAVCMTLPRHPGINASIDPEAGSATYHRYINLGLAVDTERGLLVPNIKDAHDLTVAGMARAINDLAKRTRGKQLGPDEIAGGTFTITNTGSMGTLFDTPILNPPEAAILATPAIEKRPVVISDGLSDSIAIRWMTYLCLTYDHRMVDGADAARFLQDLKYVLERHDFATELGA